MRAGCRGGVPPVLRGTKIDPSDFDRRMLRMFLAVMPWRSGSLCLDDRPFRPRLERPAFAVLRLTVGLAIVRDVRVRQYMGRGRSLPPPTLRKPAPPPSQPHWIRRRP